MNYIKHMNGFFDRITVDERLNPTHVSLYIALFQQWNMSRFVNPISVSRSELMRISKICSKATYHKCLRQLDEFNYIQYLPSSSPNRGSRLYLYDLQAGVEPGFEDFKNYHYEQHNTNEGDRTADAGKNYGEPL